MLSWCCRDAGGDTKSLLRETYTHAMRM